MGRVLVADSFTAMLRHWRSDRRASPDDMARLALLALIILTVGPLLVAVGRLLLSTHKHRVPVGQTVGTSVVVYTLLFIVPLIGLTRRKRWGWILLVFLSGLLIVSEPFDFNGPVALSLDVIRLGLLLSPPIRRYVDLAKPARPTARRRNHRSE